MQARNLASFLYPLIILTGSLAAADVHHAMVVTQEPYAADVGLQVLRQGGNAVDAAVAVAFALAVTHPSAGNIGGGGFMLVRMNDGRSEFIDFRGTAPTAASRNMFIGQDGEPTMDGLYSWRAACVPGTVRGMDLALKHFGTKRWADLIRPAVKLAEDGFVITPEFQASVADSSSHFDAQSKQQFETGDKVLKQPEFARTLKAIADGGADVFYTGWIADRFAEQMQKHGGLITKADLANYTAIARKPLEGDYHGFHIFTAPPPSAGGAGLLQMLAMLDRTPYSKMALDSALGIHYGAEAMRRFYADRSEYFGDPDFVNVPVQKLLDSAYVASRSRTILPDAATQSAAVASGVIPVNEGTETTHFNVVDEKGNAVALTYTLNDSFGTGFTVPELGFVLNNDMDDFVAKPGSPNMFGLVGGDADAIAPGKRPLSSMTPTIITKDGRFFAALGAPGGSTITTGVLQVLIDILDFRMGAAAAVDAPRYHQQWLPDVLSLEDGFPEQVRETLMHMGYQLKPIKAVGRVEVIANRDGQLDGAFDKRQGGKVAAY